MTKETKGTITVTYDDDTSARRVLGAVHADDDEFASTRTDGPTLVAELRGTDARSLLRAADDFLACLGVAEDVMNGAPMEPPNA